MARPLMFLLATVLTGLFLVPSVMYGTPLADCMYKLYHYETGNWVRYESDDTMPPGGATPGTNQWKYNYWVTNLGASANLNQLSVYFNPDNVLRSAYSSAAAPTAWTPTYYAPTSGNNDWRVRFRTTDPLYQVAAGDTLEGFEVRFAWVDPLGLPGSQNYILAWSGSSEPGNTSEMPAEMTPLEETTWGRIKGLFR